MCVKCAQLISLIGENKKSAWIIFKASKNKYKFILHKFFGNSTDFKTTSEGEIKWCMSMAKFKYVSL